MTFDRILPYDYEYHDVVSKDRLKLQELKKTVTEEHEKLPENGWIEFVFENQSSGEGKVSSQITKNTRSKPCTATNGEGRGSRAGKVVTAEALIDICHIEGGMINEQWTGPISPAQLDEMPLRNLLRGLHQRRWFRWWS